MLLLIPLSSHVIQNPQFLFSRDKEVVNYRELQVRVSANSSTNNMGKYDRIPAVMPLVQHSEENLEVEKTITNLTLENF